jgi:hypothetical protein
MNTRVKLTKAQNRILDEIKSCSGGHLRLHMKFGTTTLSYRLMDSDLSPIKSLSYSMVNKLIALGVIRKQGHIFIVVENY